jgi:translation elongation factor EF-Ts
MEWRQHIIYQKMIQEKINRFVAETHSSTERCERIYTLRQNYQYEEKMHNQRKRTGILLVILGRRYLTKAYNVTMAETAHTPEVLTLRVARKYFMVDLSTKPA